MEIYDGNISDITNFDTDKFLVINSCGFQNRPKDSVVIRRSGRVDYHLVLVTKGGFEVEYGGKLHRLNKGGVFIYEPGEKHYYRATSESSSFWLHFAGTAVREILCDMDMDAGVYNADVGAAAAEEFLKLVRYFGSADGRRYACGTLLSLLALISDGIHGRRRTDRSEPIHGILEYMSMNYEKRLTVGEMAERAGYSVSRFQHLFSDTTGTTPMRYLCDIRLSNACELLGSSEYRIKDIAALCGFEDSLYFCRVFKRKYGASPSEYREKCGRGGRTK